MADQIIVILQKLEDFLKKENIEKLILDFIQSFVGEEMDHFEEDTNNKNIIHVFCASPDVNTIDGWVR